MSKGKGCVSVACRQVREEAWPSLTTREKGQFSKHLCLFGCVNHIVFERSLGCGSKALQRLRSFLYSVGRHISYKSHSLKGQVSLNTCSVAYQSHGHGLQHPGWSRPRTPGTTWRGFQRPGSPASTWDGAALPSARSKTDLSPSALPARIQQARCSPEGLGTLPLACEICLALVS